MSPDPADGGVRVGVISDTHGLLRDEALEALVGSDLIVHAGDVGDPDILERLATIAPVHAVRGNTDTEAWARSLPHTEVVSAGAGDLYVVHDIEELDLDPGAARMAAVVYGHSHRPAMDRRNGVLFFNPGAAGHRRFRLPVSVGRIRVHPDGSVDADIIELEVGE